MAALGLQLGPKLAALHTALANDLTALQAVIAAGTSPAAALQTLAADAQAMADLCRVAANASSQGMIG